MANENFIHKIIIEGEVFTNYSNYSYIDLKTYKEPPIRSGPTIVNLNHYDTFITARLTLSYDYMVIEDYRRIMKLITYGKNEFDVICYDIINDRQVRKKMYFEPKENANFLILVKSGLNIETQITQLAVLGEPFALISTNADLDLLPILFNANGGTLVGNNPNGEGMYGEYFEMPNGSEWQKTGYLVDSYNTQPDGSGIKYLPNFIIQITHPLTLYAQYRINTTFKLSFDYNGAIPPSEEDPNFIAFKDVTYNQPIGVLPQPTKDDHTFGGWYWVIPNDNIPNLEDTKVNSTDNYPYQYNKICYAKWTKIEP